MKNEVGSVHSRSMSRIQQLNSGPASCARWITSRRC